MSSAPDLIIKLFADLGEAVPEPAEILSGKRLPAGAYIALEDDRLIWIRSSGTGYSLTPSGYPLRAWLIAPAMTGPVDLTGDPVEVVRRLRPPVRAGQVVPAWMVPPRAVVFAVETDNVICRFVERGEIAVHHENPPDRVMIETNTGIWEWSSSNYVGGSRFAACVVLALDVIDFRATCATLTQLVRELRLVGVAARGYAEAVHRRHGLTVTLADAHRWCGHEGLTLCVPGLPEATHEDKLCSWAMGDLDGLVHLAGQVSDRVVAAAVLASATHALDRAGPTNKCLWSGAPHEGTLAEVLTPATAALTGLQASTLDEMTTGETFLVPAGVGRVDCRDRTWVMVDRPYVVGYATEENRELWKAEVVATLHRRDLSATVPNFAPITPIVTVLRTGADGGLPDVSMTFPLDAASATR